MQTKMSLQLYQVDSRTYLLDFRSIDGKIQEYFCTLASICVKTEKWRVFFFLLSFETAFLTPWGVTFIFNLFTSVKAKVDQCYLECWISVSLDSARLSCLLEQIS